MDNNELLLNNKVAGGVIISTCSLWKQISCISTIVLLIGFYQCVQLECNLLLGLMVLAFLLCQYFCLRLNLDSKLFKVLYENIDDLTSFDKAIELLFNKNKESRTLDSRILGTKKLFQVTIVSLLAQVTLFLTSICFM